MAAFVAKQMVGNKLSAVKGECPINYYLSQLSREVLIIIKIKAKLIKQTIQIRAYLKTPGASTKVSLFCSFSI